VRHITARVKWRRSSRGWGVGTPRSTEEDLRKQYYLRPSDRGLLAWDVDRLVALSRHLPRRRVPLIELRELDEEWLDGKERPTWRAVVEHMRLIEEADLTFPIILSADSSVMDGRHRLAKAALQGRKAIDAVQFAEDPPPDYVGRDLDDLPY
jgi:hypothetical protein